MADLKCKVLVIGAGPGGYVCAIRAGQLGLDTIVVEADRPGGTCLNIGCIPSKALIHAADEFWKVRAFNGDAALGISVSDPTIDLERTQAWMGGIVSRLNGGVASLLQKAGVKTVAGHARFLDGKTVSVATGDGKEQRIRAETIVIATGSAPIELPLLPFGGDIISSTEALALREVPDRLAVVGAGYIGLEIGTAFAKLGSEVTVIEAMDRILSQYDAALVGPVVKRLEALGVRILTSAKAQDFSDGRLIIEGASEGSGPVAADKVLVAVGRRPRTQSVGLEELGLTMQGDFITVDDHCRTSMRGVFAIGDVTGEPMLAHRSMAQGEMVAHIIAGDTHSWDKVAMPAVCFTDPEIVTVGLSPAEAEAKGLEIAVGQFPFQANGRAMTTEREDGFIRVVARKDNGLVLGIQAVGEGISELSATFGLTLEMGGRLEDVAATVHAHPTRGEALQEAAMKALGIALHV
jgi:dihydrolipoamide dehydrogenase